MSQLFIWNHDFGSQSHLGQKAKFYPFHGFLKSIFSMFGLLAAGEKLYHPPNLRNLKSKMLKKKKTTVGQSGPAQSSENSSRKLSGRPRGVLGQRWRQSRRHVLMWEELFHFLRIYKEKNRILVNCGESKLTVKYSCDVRGTQRRVRVRQRTNLCSTCQCRRTSIFGKFKIQLEIFLREGMRLR